MRPGQCSRCGSTPCACAPYVFAPNGEESELTRLRDENARLTAENAALKAGKWAGPRRVKVRDDGRRFVQRWATSPGGAAFQVVLSTWEHDADNADRELAAMGWYLADEPRDGTAGGAK